MLGYDKRIVFLCDPTNMEHMHFLKKLNVSPISSSGLFGVLAFVLGTIGDSTYASSHVSWSWGLHKSRKDHIAAAPHIAISPALVTSPHAGASLCAGSQTSPLASFVLQESGLGADSW